MSVESKTECVAVLGASENPERYSYKAWKALEKHGHKVFLVNPKYDEIEGTVCYPSVTRLPQQIDSLTVYLNANMTTNMKQDIISSKTKRVIFNPGSENPELMKALDQEGVITEQACTLVLLSTGQF